jgi:hypothetical protein
MAAVITPQRVSSFWDEFVSHRDTDRGEWLAEHISMPYRDPNGVRRPSIYDDERLRRAVIRFARTYIPDRSTWEARLPKAFLSPDADEPAALSEDDVLAILEGEDALANALADLMQDDLEAWLRAAGFRPETAAAARDCGAMLLPRGMRPTAP